MKRFSTKIFIFQNTRFINTFCNLNIENQHETLQKSETILQNHQKKIKILSQYEFISHLTNFLRYDYKTSLDNINALCFLNDFENIYNSDLLIIEKIIKIQFLSKSEINMFPQLLNLCQKLDKQHQIKALRIMFENINKKSFLFLITAQNLHISLKIMPKFSYINDEFGQTLFFNNIQEQYLKLNDIQRKKFNISFYYDLLKNYNLFKIHAKLLFDQCELIFLKNLKNSLKSLIISFLLLNQQESGLKIYEKIMEYDQYELLQCIEEMNEKQKIQVLHNLFLFNIQQNITSLSMKQIKQSQFFIEKQKLQIQIQKKQDTFFKIFENINIQILKPDDIQSFLNYYRILFLFNQLTNLLIPHIDDLTSKSKKILKNQYKNIEEENNEFSCDIINILQKESIQYLQEYWLQYRQSDFYLIKENTILELDGKFHFYRNSNTHTTSSKARNFFLMLHGYKLIVINIRDWEIYRETDQMHTQLMEKINQDYIYQG